MASNPFSGNQNITLDKNTKAIRVTKRTIRFSTSVYQTKNIAGFSEGDMDIGGVPWGLIILVFIIGLTVNSFNGFAGGFLILAAIGGAIWNFAKPKYYGLLLTLNSGDKTLFVAPDKPGLKKVISDIYDFIETEKEVTYEISIVNSQVLGNFIQGSNIGEDSSLNINR